MRESVIIYRERVKCVIMMECIPTKPRHQQEQRSLHMGQAVFTLAKELQLYAETVSLGLDIISPPALVNFSKK